MLITLLDFSMEVVPVEQGIALSFEHPNGTKVLAPMPVEAGEALVRALQFHLRETIVVPPGPL